MLSFMLQHNLEIRTSVKNCSPLQVSYNINRLQRLARCSQHGYILPEFWLALAVSASSSSPAKGQKDEHGLEEPGSSRGVEDMGLLLEVYGLFNKMSQPSVCQYSAVSPELLLIA